MIVNERRGFGDFDGGRVRFAMVDGYDDFGEPLPANNGYGGQLPLAAWSKADQLVQMAWDTYATLEKSVVPQINANNSYLIGALNTFKQNIVRFSEQTERLKHGPAFESPTVITDYVAWGNDFKRWADSINKTAVSTSTWTMWTTIGSQILNDVSAALQAVGKSVINTGKNTLMVLEWLPFIAIGLGAVFLFAKGGGGRRREA